MSQKPIPRRRALVVGVGVYEDNGFTNLRCCATDAFAIKDILEERGPAEKYLDDANFHVEYLINEEGDTPQISTDIYEESDSPHPTRPDEELAELPAGDPNTDCSVDNIYRQIDILLRYPQRYEASASEGRGAKDCDLVLYFSGHGDSGGYGLNLMGSDSAASDPWSGVSLDLVLSRARYAEFGSFTIILDCCRSGSAGDLFIESWSRAVAYLPENVFIIAACGSENPAFSGVTHSVFTQALIDVFDRNKQPISPLDLYSSAESITGSAGEVEEISSPVFKFHLSRNPYF